MRTAIPATLRRIRRSLNDSLFAAAPASEQRLRAPEAALLVVAFLCLAAILQLLRVGPGTALDSVWAEDGPIFLQGAMEKGVLDALTSTYAGYFVLAPRLIGEVGASVPLHDAAAAMAIAATLVVALCGVVIWIASAALIRNPLLRGTLVLVVVLCPVASLESVASGSYVPWYMLVASFWVLLWRPRSDRGAWLGGGFVLATALSTAGIWFLAPLAGLRAISIRDRRDGIIVGAYALGSAIQVPALALSDEEAVQPLWSAQIWKALLQRVLDGGALGERLGGIAWEALGWPLLVALLVLAAIGLALGLRHSGAGPRWLALVAAPTAIVMFVASAYQRAVGPQMAWPADTYFGAGGRYAIVPAMLLVSLAVVMADAAVRRRGSRRGPLWAGLACAFLLVVAAISFDVMDTTARGAPGWDEALSAAEVDCDSEPVPAATVPISPPSFGLAISCRNLGAD